MALVYLPARNVGKSGRKDTHQSVIFNIEAWQDFTFLLGGAEARQRFGGSRRVECEVIYHITVATGGAALHASAVCERRAVIFAATTKVERACAGSKGWCDWRAICVGHLHVTGELCAATVRRNRRVKDVGRRGLLRRAGTASTAEWSKAEKQRRGAGAVGRETRLV